MATGIGERLEPVRLGTRDFVLVFPAVSIPTADVFSDPGLKRDSGPITLGQARDGMGRNDCEAVVRRRWPEMDRAFERLGRWGHPLLTGTGSGIFLPVENRAAAEATAREIKSHYNSRAVRGVDRSPVHEKLYTGGM